MLTPDTYEGAPRSRLHLEVTPNHTPTSPGNSQNTPGKTHSSLHFNSQQYRTPSTSQAHPHLRYLNSPHSGTPPGIPGSKGAREIPHLTPRSTPRFQQLRKTPSSGGSFSSRGCRTPGMTPTEYIRNPFERNPESMSGWVFSPGVFAPKGSEGKGSPFWSIDNIAMLKPADIDENAVKVVGSLDSEVEERTQKAIEDFFKKDVIVPSPWSDNGDKKRLHFLPQTPVTPGIVPMTTSSKISSPANKDGKKESQYYTQGSVKEETSPEVLSTSSLRRKLFTNGELESPHSPMRERPRSLPMDSEPSPTAETLCLPPDTNCHSNHTPPSNLFSSSPIRSDSDREPQTPSLRRCSTAPDLMTSPELSPIGRSGQRARKQTDKEDSPLSDNTPLCRPLQATPSSGRPSLPFTSPGVSPIRLEISAVHDHPHDGAPHSWESRRVKSLHVKIPAPSEISADDSALSLRPGDDPTTTTNNTSAKFLKDMEVDQDLSLTQDPFAASDGFRVLRGFSDFSESVVYQDPSQHPAHSTYATHSHDTGYQTNSLQSTNHDTGLHTNLTNQFGSLLPLSSRDTGLEEDINESASMDFNHIDPQTLFSSTRIPLSYPDDETTRDAEFSIPLLKTDPKKQTSIIKTTLDESLVRRQARKALGQLDANQMGSGKVAPGKPGSMQSEEHNCVTSQVVSQWKATVPTPLRRQLRQVGLIGDTTVEEQDLLPSAIASKALQRAGEDFDLFCGEPLKTFRKPKKSIVFKEILTPDITDLQEQELFKCS